PLALMAPSARSTPGPRDPAIEVGAEAGPADVATLQSLDREAALFDHSINRSIQMAATGYSSPDRGQPILPSENPRIRRTSVLDEDHATLRAEAAPEPSKRESRVLDRAERPRRHHPLHRSVVERDGLGWSREELHRKACALRAPCRHAPESLGWLEGV